MYKIIISSASDHTATAVQIHPLSQVQTAKATQIQTAQIVLLQIVLLQIAQRVRLLPHRPLRPVILQTRRPKTRKRRRNWKEKRKGNTNYKLSDYATFIRSFVCNTKRPSVKQSMKRKWVQIWQIPQYWHLVVQNGNFTLVLTSSGQEWQVADLPPHTDI